MRQIKTIHAISITRFHILNRIGALAILLMLMLTVTHSQSSTDGSTPSGVAPGSPAGSYSLSGFENVNLFTGNLDVHVPLLKIGGRGEAVTAVAVAVNPEPWITKGTGPWHDWWTTLKPGYGPGVLQGRRIGVRNDAVGTYCSQDGLYHYKWTRTTLTFTASDGTEYELRDKLSGGQWFDAGTNYCSTGSTRGTEFVTADGSFATFISDATIIDRNRYYTNTDQNIFPSGYLMLKNGIRYRIDNGLVSWIRDRNGNLLSFLNGLNPADPLTYRKVLSATDPLGRVVSFQYNQSSDVITFSGVGGLVQRSITVNRAGLNTVLRSDFLNQGGCQIGSGPYWPGIKRPSQLFPTLTPLVNETCFNIPMVSSIVLPDGRSYQFKYNPYGEVARIETPIGGAIEYEMEPGSGVVHSGNVPGNFEETDQIHRRVEKRRVYVSKDDTTPVSLMTYSAQLWDEGPVAYASDVNVAVDQLDPQDNNRILARDKHYFHGNPVITMFASSPQSYPAFNEGRERKTESFDVTNGVVGSVLRRVTNVWEPGPLIATGAPAANARIQETTIELVDTNQIAKQSFSYDQYNNVSESVEYAYGTGSPSTTVLRRNITSYVTTLNGANYDTNPGIHLRSMPLQSMVKDGSNNVVSLTNYEYDNYTADTRHAALVARSSVNGICVTYDGSGQCNTNPTDYHTRGNVTGVTQYNDAATPSGAVTVSSQYDVVGNAVATLDGNGNFTQTSYADVNHYAYPTSATSSVPDPTGAHGSSVALIAYTNYDFSTGAVISQIDANGNTTTIEYNDILGRPTKIIRPQGGGWTSFEYGDTVGNLYVRTRTTLDASLTLEAYQYFDGLGRAWRSSQTEGATSILADTQYDALGRVWKVSNPYRTGNSILWTTTTYDSRGRVTIVKTPDNAEVLTAYSGNTVTVTDQAGKKRKSVTDGLGRLTSVYEAPNDTTNFNFQTSYVYDVLGNLRTVTQESQRRFFLYDSLSRLIRARNPEQGVNSSLNLSSDALTENNSQWSLAYSYDNNGNLLAKTDARGTTASFTYDALNRVTQRSYSSGTANPTPSVTYSYDANTVANSKGRLTSVSSSVSAYNYTAYDALGRVTSGQQVTDGQTYSMSYAYDLAGNITSQTYPTGRVVTQNFDGVGRLAAISGQALGGTPKTYANSFGYTTHGAVERMRLGNARWEHTTYDAKRLQPLEIGLGTSAINSSLLKLEYYYGAEQNNGNVLRQIITVPTIGADMGFTATQHYQYDQLNRLTGAQEVNGVSTAWQTTVPAPPFWQQMFSYDRFGNRAVVTANTTSTMIGPNPVISTTNNRITPRQGEYYYYDDAGNMTKGQGGETLDYDAENKLVQYQGGATQSGGANYSYDGDGRRVKKATPAETLIFIYNISGQLIAEYTTSTPVNNGTSYLTSDTLGSPRIITKSDGSVRARHDYLPFGEELFAGVGNRTANPGQRYDLVTNPTDKTRQKFTSKERDNETGLDYFLARYYSSTQGRFTSPDEFGGGAQQLVNFAEKASANPTFYSDLTQPQSLNKYQYCYNNPLRYVDPSGHEILFVYVGPSGWNQLGHAAIKHIDEDTGAVTYYDVAKDKNGDGSIRVNTYTEKEFRDRYAARGIEEVHVDVPNEAESLKYIERNESANWNYDWMTNNCVAFAAYVVEQGGGKVVSDGSRGENPRRYARDARDGYKKENEKKKNEKKKTEGDKNKYSWIDPEKLRFIPLQLFQ